jgi:hypothetical protein
MRLAALLSVSALLVCVLSVPAGAQVAVDNDDNEVGNVGLQLNGNTFFGDSEGGTSSNSQPVASDNSQICNALGSNNEKCLQLFE